MRPQKYKEPLDYVVKVRVTQSEKKKILALCDQSGLSISEMLRKKILGIKINDKSYARALGELHLIRMELNKIGGLIKHIFNENKSYSKETSKMLQAQEEAVRIIKDKIEALKVIDDDRQES
ncbi:plasmid mobilization protein [Jonquetella anthropi]|uniref:plasmid mobilization protein n=1 Tax=Jonquetella anthropi TaxID=428712 RepID=UPI0023F45A7D|nr:hypothetical protein [Jonquetella anthropi]